MSLELLKYCPCIVGALVALYWAMKISIHGTFEFISTSALRSMWIGSSVAVLWFVFLNFPLDTWRDDDYDMVKTWFVIFFGIVFLLYGIFASRKGLILFTAASGKPLYEQPDEDDFDKEVLENEPDRSKELPY
jgi:H+/Cl- antiporter ClcA